MKMTRLAFCLLVCSILFLDSGYTLDVCETPFSQFLQCFSKDADARIENYHQEATPMVKSKMQQCFQQNGCTPPDFNQAQMGFFVQEPWLTRINAFLAVLESMHPAVQHCMTDYFKGILAAKINECCKKQGPKDIKDFQMPPIPGGYNVDFSKMKMVLLDRMMIQHQLGQCAAVNGNGQVPAIIQCLKVARQETDNGMCHSRDDCVKNNIKDPNCADRFNKVQSTACQCFASDQGKQSMEKEVQNTILSGALEKNFRRCHQENGVPYPKDKVDAAKKALREGFMEFVAQRGVPPGVADALRVAQQVIGEMSEQWKNAFCSNCAPQQQLPVAPVSNQLPPAPVNANANVNGGGKFVIPPPLPPQAVPGSNQLPPQAAPPSQFNQVQQPQFAQSNAMSFEEFKLRMAQAFGPVG